MLIKHVFRKTQVWPTCAVCANYLYCNSTNKSEEVQSDKCVYAMFE